MRVRFPSPAPLSPDERAECPHCGNRADESERYRANDGRLREFRRTLPILWRTDQRKHVAHRHRATECKNEPCEQVFAKEHDYSPMASSNTWSCAMLSKRVKLACHTNRA
jgi:hypothetical protein